MNKGNKVLALLVYSSGLIIFSEVLLSSSIDLFKIVLLLSLLFILIRSVLILLNSKFNFFSNRSFIIISSILAVTMVVLFYFRFH
jgi:hypothetical protein